MGNLVLASDPAVQSVGVDIGFSPSPKTLRALDLAVGELPDQAGWVQGAPPLAVEYADTGQDEEELQLKIQETLRGRHSPCLGGAPERPPEGGSA
ncbi:MAG TPA: hypothetical protein VH988_18040 [Thermoanaerobaculia bacterium]|nr:hypothetical protein [Thermoanaerobaculia bacterium]